MAFRLANLWAVVTALFLLDRMVSTGQEFSILAVRREFCACRTSNSKRLRLILLQGAQNKCHGMISLQNHKNKPPGMISLQKKVGGGVVRRTYRAKACGAECAPTRIGVPKPFRMRTYKKRWDQGGGALGASTLDKRGGRVQFLPPGTKPLGNPKQGRVPQTT